MSDPNFSLWLDELDEGKSPPASARLRKDLRRWQGDLDPDAPWVREREKAPTRPWKHDGWAVTFRAIPKKSEARRTKLNDRAIGVYGHTGVDFINDAPAIKKALMAKHREYGDLGAPFIVAVGTYSHDTNRWHGSNALYGHSAVQIGEAPDGSTVTEDVRQPDGFFGTPPEWTNRNVSGVLLVDQLMPYHVQRAETTLWRHPNPDLELPEAIGLPGDAVNLAVSTLTVDSALMRADDFFGLPDPWPPWRRVARDQVGEHLPSRTSSARTGTVQGTPCVIVLPHRSVGRDPWRIMTLPGPLSGFPPLPSGPLPAGRRDQTGSATSLFGVDPAEVHEIARAWQSAGIAIHAADVEAVGAVIGPSSRVARALSSTARPARSAIDSIGERLTTMSGMLQMFDASTCAADVRSGARFRDLEDR